MSDTVTGTGRGASAASPPRGGLLRKYVAMFVAVVSIALAIKGTSDIWFSYQEQETLLFRIQREQAKRAAEKIDEFLHGITAGLAWVTQLPWDRSSESEWQFDAVRLMRQVPALNEIIQLDANGREQFRMSRQSPDIIASHIDHSKEPAYVEALAHKVYYGPVYFIDQSQPFMTIAMVGARPEFGAVIAQVNLTFIWDVVSQIRVGNDGDAYVVDDKGRLIAHPDISQVLRKTDMTVLTQVRAAEAGGHGDEPLQGRDLTRRRVLSAYARVPSTGWLVFAELPIAEAYAPLYQSALRSAALILVALVLAIFAGFLLARRMVVPIRALHEGAVRIGGGELAQRISIETGDELEALGEQFNRMAERLQDSYATLERKVEERTQQLELANLAKSRFIAVASHDLRQPLHALGLFFAQLHGRMSAAQRRQLLERIDAALSSMNELFNALLDISKLDAGALKRNVTEFPVADLLKRVETTFTGPAQEKGLTLRIVPTSAWVRSDFILLERIAFNLVSNAVRYTSYGGVLVGCRKRGEGLRIEVCDTGPGIPSDQYQNIFSEFYRLSETDRVQRGGLGLGLAIVERLCRLLDHPIELTATVGRGSRFAVTVPIANPAYLHSAPTQMGYLHSSDGQLVAVIDDDPPALEGMRGLLQSWGYRVAAGTNDAAALARLAEYGDPPELIISDYRLSNGATGIEIIDRLRRAMNADIPAFLISGDTDTQIIDEARIGGYQLMHKPVEPAALRALVSQLLKRRGVAEAQPHRMF